MIHRKCCNQAGEAADAPGMAIERAKLPELVIFLQNCSFFVIPGEIGIKAFSGFFSAYLPTREDVR